MILRFLENIKLNRDREKLVAKLNRASMRELIEQMENDKPFSSVVSKRRERYKNYNTGDDISWFAYRVSDKLNSPKHKTELMELLVEDNFQQYKSTVYRALGSLCANTSDYHLFNFLMKQIDLEDDEGMILSILLRLDKLVKPETLELGPIKQLAANGTYEIRKVALRALANSEHNEVEDLLLYEFKISDKHLKGMICNPLCSVGTGKSIPVLNAAYKETRDPFLRWAISHALEEIEKRGHSNS